MTSKLPPPINKSRSRLYKTSNNTTEETTRGLGGVHQNDTASQTNSKTIIRPGRDIATFPASQVNRPGPPPVQPDQKKLDEHYVNYTKTIKWNFDPVFRTKSNSDLPRARGPPNKPPTTFTSTLSKTLPAGPGNSVIVRVPRERLGSGPHTPEEVLKSILNPSKSLSDLPTASKEQDRPYSPSVSQFLSSFRKLEMNTQAATQTVSGVSSRPSSRSRNASEENLSSSNYSAKPLNALSSSKFTDTFSRPVRVVKPNGAKDVGSQTQFDMEFFAQASNLVSFAAEELSLEDFNEFRELFPHLCRF